MNINKLSETIKSNITKIGRVFGDDFTPESICMVHEGYLKYFESIVEHPEVDKSATVPFHKFDCIYFLMDGDYVSYIGQTAHLCERLSTHSNDGKKFDGVSWYGVEKNDMLIIEAFNIAHHNPSLNIEIQSMINLILMVSRKVR